MTTTDEEGYPTIGDENGVTIYATSPDDSGGVSYDGPESVNELLQVAGVKQIDDEEDIRERLPEDAELLDDGRLRAKNNRDYGGWDYLNGKRRFILQKIAEGMEPMRVVENYDFAQSYIYRTKIVFGFLVEDAILRGAFIESGGKFAPTYDPDEEEDEEEESMSPEEHQEEKEEQLEEQTIPVEEAREMAEEAYQNGLEEGREEASAPEPEPDTELFNGDEWWDIMKTLMENGQDEYARRIASEIDFD